MFKRTSLSPKTLTIKILLIATLIMTSCSAQTADTVSQGVASTADSTSPQVEPTSPPTADGKTETKVSDAPVEPAPQALGAIDVWAMDMHPNGSQVVITKVVATNQETTIEGSVLNGRDFETRMNFADDDAMLLPSSGAPLEGLGGVELSLEPGEIADFRLTFGALEPDTERITLQLNVDDSDDRDIGEGSPGFSVDDIALVPSVPPALPADLAIQDSAAHPSTAAVQVEGVSFTDTHIGVGFVATVGAGSQRSLSSGHHASFLEDDLGNRYRLKFDGDERFIRVDDGEEARGVLVFAGRIDPDATELTMVLNEEESTTDARSSKPKFVLGPWPLDGSFEPTSMERAPITIEETQVHANTSQVTLQELTFSSAGAVANVSAINPRRVAIRLNPCCDASYLLDDLGNRYILLGPADNDGIIIEGDSGIEGEFTFAGRVVDEATSIELILGDRGEDGLNDPTTGFPEFRFGPYDLRTTTVAGSAITPPSGFGTTSSFVTGALEASTSTEAALIFSEFSGIEIPGGVQLTLPEGILFDSGESRLRSGASASIDKVVQILEFYAGDEVIVVGHTDSEGSEAFNQGLSSERATEVRLALVQSGAVSSLLSVDGRGESQPIASNESEAGRSENRRVEIVILTTKGLPE